MFERRTKIRKAKYKRNTHEENTDEIHTQSPIALTTPDAINVYLRRPLKLLEHWNSDGDALVTNNGYTAYLTFVNRNRPPSLSGGPLLQDYTFEQLHFHWGEDNNGGSEHSIDGRRFTAEAHLVYYNNKYANFNEAISRRDGLAVIAFLLRATNAENPSFAPLSSAVTDITENQQETTLQADCLRWMQDRNPGEYFTYKGSLTTEPYHESVTWIVYKQPIDISIEQVEPFRRMEIYKECDRISCNARDLQSAPDGHRVHLIRPGRMMRGARLKSEMSHKEGTYPRVEMIYDSVPLVTF